MAGASAGGVGGAFEIDGGSDVVVCFLRKTGNFFQDSDEGIQPVEEDV